MAPDNVRSMTLWKRDSLHVDPDAVQHAGIARCRDVGDHRRRGIATRRRETSGSRASFSKLGDPQGQERGGVPAYRQGRRHGDLLLRDRSRAYERAYAREGRLAAAGRDALATQLTITAWHVAYLKVTDPHVKGACSILASGQRAAACLQRDPNRSLLRCEHHERGKVRVGKRLSIGERKVRPGKTVPSENRILTSSDARKESAEASGAHLSHVGSPPSPSEMRTKGIKTAPFSSGLNRTSID
jgi:hypothetical protein